jgi:hypothetical protein
MGQTPFALVYAQRDVTSIMATLLTRLVRRAREISALLSSVRKNHSLLVDFGGLGAYFGGCWWLFEQEILKLKVVLRAFQGLEDVGAQEALSLINERDLLTYLVIIAMYPAPWLVWRCRQWWLLYRSASLAPRAWVVLESPSSGRLCLRVTETGGVEAAPISEGQAKFPRSSPEASLAIAPDGSVIATVVGQELRFHEVDTKSGSVYFWRGPIQIPKSVKAPRVLAIAPRGEDDVRLALATDKSLIFLSTIGELSEADSLRQLQVEPPVTHAAFLGTLLLFIKNGRVWEWTSDTHGSREWGSSSGFVSQEAKIIAVDTSLASGVPVVALLMKRSDGATYLLMMTADGDEIRRLELEEAANDLVLVRDRQGEPGTPCALAGTATKMKVSCFRESEATGAVTRQNVRRWWPLNRIRHRKAGAEVPVRRESS